MLIPISLIHQTYDTLTITQSATASTCRLLAPGSPDCDDCPACLPDAVAGYQCGFTKADNPDYAKSLEAYYQVYPESLI